jgi:hypothetical protein
MCVAFKSDFSICCRLPRVTEAVNHSRGVYNVERNEGLERLHLRNLRGHHLHVWLPDSVERNAAGLSLRRLVHLRLELRVRARRELRLRRRLTVTLLRRDINVSGDALDDSHSPNGSLFRRAMFEYRRCMR